MLKDLSNLVGQVFSVPDAPNNSVLIATKAQDWVVVKAVVDQLDRPRQQIMLKALFAEVTHDDSPQSMAFFSALDRQSLFHVAGSTNAMIATANQEVASTFQKLTDQGKVEILSRPYVLAKDNQRASISLGRTEKGLDPNFSGDVTSRIDIIPHLAVDGQIVLDLVDRHALAGEPGLMKSSS